MIKNRYRKLKLQKCVDGESFDPKSLIRQAFKVVTKIDAKNMIRYAN